VTRLHIAEERIFQPPGLESFTTRTYVLDRKREEKRTFGRPGSEVKDGMETDVIGTEFEALGKIYVTQDRNQSLF
jgi:hypothetical protein